MSDTNDILRKLAAQAGGEEEPYKRFLENKIREKWNLSYPRIPLYRWPD